MATIAKPPAHLVNWLWLVLGATFFLLPLFATGWFSLKTARGHLGFEAYAEILRDPSFLASLAFSFKLAIVAIVLVLMLLVPTAYWVHLKLSRVRPVIDFLSILPIVVPPIVLVVGLLRGFSWTPAWFYGGYTMLVVGYVVLAFPYVYRSLDAGLSGMDIRTLTEAAQSLGANWPILILRVIVPNLRSSLLAAAFLTLAMVMGEFTMALLMQYTTFAVYMSNIWESRGTGAAALSLLSFAITWFAMLGIVLVGGRLGRRAAQIGVTR